jgi:hypothetical protein
MKLTKDQMREVYYAITSQNQDFVLAMAEIALEQAMATKADMWSASCGDITSPVPTISDAKEMAKDYFADMLTDWEIAHRDAVENLRRKVEFELRAQLTWL